MKQEKEIKWIEDRFYISYECRFCRKYVNKEDLELHQEKCEG